MTKLYFHAASSTVGGTLPSTEQSGANTSAKDVDAQSVNRSMDTSIGAAQTSIALASLANVNPNTYYFTKFVSDALKGAQTITAQTWNYAFATQESNVGANFPVSGSTQLVPINVYVWRPSTGAKIGTILDGFTGTTVNEPASANTETSEFASFSGSAVSAADGDVIICEIWFSTTQAAATSRTCTFFFDGQTETNNTGTTVSAHASYIETPQSLTFTRNVSKSLTETITISESAKANIIPPAGVNANISVKKMTLTLDATSGVHDQAFTGVGFQPKAMIVWGVLTAANDAYQEGVSMSYGFSDGTTNGSIAGANVDNVTTLDNSCMIRNDACVSLLSAAAGNAEIVRSVVKTFDTDGVTLTHNVKTNTTQYILHALFLGGSDITNVKVKHETTGTVATGNRGYTGYGFKPDIMFFATAGNIALNTLTAGTFFGLGAGRSTTSQFTETIQRSDNTGANSGGTARFDVRNDSALETLNASGVATIKVSLNSLDTDGYTLNHLSAAAATTFPFIAFAVKGGYWDTAVIQQRSGAGTQTVTAVVGGTPAGLMLYGTGVTAVNTIQSNPGDNGGMSIGGADSTSEGYAASFDLAVTSPSTTAMYSSTAKATRCYTPTATATSSTLRTEADSDMTSAGQFSLGWTTADATLRRIGYVFLMKGIVSAGNNIARSLTETIGISEAIARLNTKIRTSTETVSIPGSVVKVKAANRSPVAETITLSGSVVRQANKTRGVSESLALSASLARQTNKARSLPPQTLTISEGLARLVAKTRPISQTLSISDSLARQTNKARSLSETISISDLAARLIAKTRSLSQTLSLSDSVTATKSAGVNNVVKSLTESLAITDSVNRLKTIQRSITESTAISDLVARLVIYKAEILRITDSVAITVTLSGVKHISKSLTETVAIADSLARQANKVRSVSQTISVSDSLARLKAARRSLAETITITDLTTKLKSRFRTLTESITLTGVPTRLKAVSKPISQSLSISDVVAKQAAKIRSITQAITFADIATGTKTTGQKFITKTLTETLAISDALNRQAKKVRSLTQTITILDALTRQTNKVRALPESITFSDVIGRTRVRLKTLTESISISDNLTRQARKIRGISQTVSITDVATRQLNKFRSISQSISFLDAAARTITHGAKNITLFLNESIAISEILTRTAFKVRTITQTITFADILNKSVGKTRTLPTQTITLFDAVTATGTHVKNIVKALAESIDLSTTLARRATKTRALPAQTITFSDSVSRLRVKIKQIPAETISLSGTVARKAAKVRTLATQVITISDLIKVYLNGLEITPRQIPGKGGGYIFIPPKIRQILYPVYSPEAMRRIERRRKLRLYQPLAVIPAFAQTANKVVAPFVVTSINNGVSVKFAIVASTLTANMAVFTGVAAAVKIADRPRNKTAAKFIPTSEGLTKMLDASSDKLARIARLAKTSKVLKIWLMARELFGEDQ